MAKLNGNPLSICHWRKSGSSNLTLRLLPNHLVEEALAAAQSDDLAPLTALVQVLQNPYDFVVGQERYAATAPQDFGTYRTFCGT